MLAQRSPQMRKAVGVLKELSADEVTRMLFEKREMARRDVESMVEMVRRDAEAERHKWQGVVADKDAEITSKDAEITSKNAENEQLRAQIEELQARLGEKH